MDKSKWDHNDWWDWLLGQSDDSIVTELQCQYNELSSLKALVRKMVPHLRYLSNIPNVDTVSWAPDKETKNSIQIILTHPLIKTIMEEPMPMVAVRREDLEVVKTYYGQLKSAAFWSSDQNKIDRLVAALEEKP